MFSHIVIPNGNCNSWSNFNFIEWIFFNFSDENLANLLVLTVTFSIFLYNFLILGNSRFIFNLTNWMIDLTFFMGSLFQVRLCILEPKRWSNFALRQWVLKKQNIFVLKNVIAYCENENKVIFLAEALSMKVYNIFF